MKTSIVLLLVGACLASAQVQVCQNSKPGMVRAASIKMASTAYQTNQGSSSLTINWPRPQDGNPPSCITDYFVDVYGRDGNKVQQATVSNISPAHTGTSYTANGLAPGQPYQFTVTPKGPAGTGPTDIRSTPFTTAGAPTPSCGQPQMVTNIRREGAQPSGSMMQMTVAWDKPSATPSECIREYSVTVYEAGKSNAIKTTTVYAPNTRFTDNIYYPGKGYEFWIYARNPNLGAMGNGVGIRSQPIYAPTQAVPL